MVLWILAGLLLLALIAWGALQIAIARNGPAVLSTVDRIAGGARGAEQKAVISTGNHPSQKVVVWGAEHRDPALAPAPVLLFTHGGSWENGDPVDYGVIGRHFVRNGFIVVLAGYRLGEDGRYPAMLEDTASAVHWTHENIASYGGDPSQIVIAGHSAGAYNVVMTALEEQWLGRRGLSADAIAGVVGLAGPYDFFPFDSDSTRAAFGHAAEPEMTQPLAHVPEDAGTGTPPLLLIHGEADTVVKVRNSRALEAALSAAGASVSTLYTAGHTHGDPIYALAAPWRTRGSHSPIAEVVTAFARDPDGFGASEAGKVSVPVQAETR